MRLPTSDYFCRDAGAQISLEEFLAGAGLFLWCLQYYIGYSGYVDLLGGRSTKLLQLAALGLFALKILLDQVTLQARLIWGAGLGAVYLLIISRQAGVGMQFLSVLVMLCAVKNIPFRKICAVMFAGCALGMVLVVGGDRLGIIHKEVMVDTSGNEDRIRDYLGFYWVAFGGIFIQNIIWTWCYARTDRTPLPTGRRRQVSWGMLIVLELINYWFYAKTQTNLPFAITTLFLVLYALVVRLHVNVFHDCALTRILAGLFYPLLALLSYLIMIFYEKGVPFWDKINSFTHTRANLSHVGYLQYGIRLLGTNLQETGLPGDPDYFYIDSGYCKLLLQGGLLLTVLVLLLYSFLFVQAVRSQDLVLCCWLLAVALYSTMNNLILSPCSNASFLAFWTMADYAAQRRKWIQEGRARALLTERT